MINEIVSTIPLKPSLSFPDTEKPPAGVLLDLGANELEKKPCKEWVKYYFCYNCGKIHSRTQTCNERYSRCCYNERFKRNIARLKSLKIISKRMVHVIVGFPKENKKLDKHNKKELEKILVKFHRKLRIHYLFRGIRIFDLADDGMYEHFHYAIIPESKQLDVKVCRRILKQVSGGYVKTLKVMGFRYKSGLLKYFAKRVSGLYGHGKHEFFLEDIMSYKEYKNYFFNVRFVTIIGRFPEGLTCINAQSRLCCPYCGSLDIEFVGITRVNEEFIPSKSIEWLKNEIEQTKLIGLGVGVE